jgi:acyl-CoA reductase-like NAD-dependent aldehyde dehydrogenase
MPVEPHRTPILLRELTPDLFAGRGRNASDAEVIARNLASSLEARYHDLVALCQSETGIALQDAEESIAGCVAFLRSFEHRDAEVIRVPATGDRRVEIYAAPWGTVIAILPQNAFLFLGLVCMVHALDCGNRVVLRVPSGSRGTASILADCLVGIDGVTLADINAKDLLDAFFASPTPGLVHYFGGSGRIPDLMERAFRAGKGLIADGEGNTWVYVAEGTDPASAADILCSGAIRYNGQTCTSVNGAVIHPSIYDDVLQSLVGRIKAASAGPLSDQKSAEWCVEIIGKAGGEVVVGGQQEGARLEPTLVVGPDFGSTLVKEGVFGPSLWVAPGGEEVFRELWPSNRYPLCAAVLGPLVEPSDWTGLGNLARLVVNGDPSLEDPLEPWGGYPSSGNSRVSHWHEKYWRTVQVDRDLT